MSIIEKSIDVNVSVRAAYNQWTQFEDFPKFMEGVESVQQKGDKKLHWKANIGGKTKEWVAEIVEQTADEVIAWHSITGAPNVGTVRFQPLGADEARVTIQMEYAPDGFVENVGDAVGVVSRRVEGDLNRFKEFIESRGAPTGGWRGEIHGGQVQK